MSSSRKPRNESVGYDKRRYWQRIHIEIMFGSLKEWRHTDYRYNRCSNTFYSAIALDTKTIFWL